MRFSTHKLVDGCRLPPRPKLKSLIESLYNCAEMETSDFYEGLVEFLGELSPDLDSETLPFRIMEYVRKTMNAENVLLVGVDGKLIGDWWVHNPGWRVKSFSMDVVTKAIRSERGYWRGSLEENPSDSQMFAQIHSCVAARVQIGKEIVGTIYCDVREGDRRFTDEDGARLKTLADCLTVYLRHYSAMLRLAETPVPERSPSDRAKVNPDNFLIGETKQILSLRSEIASAAKLSSPVLLLGETGVGKEVAARLIHDLSGRKGNFVALNCCAISKELFESELFGHEKGAFSGAIKTRSGLIMTANRGTLFIDEIGDMPPEIQIKLLRVLADKKVRPVGSDVELGPLNFRLVCATNTDLKDLVTQKLFREDLFYRISSVPLTIPPLRERLSDIPLLVDFFASPKKLSAEAVDLLQSVFDWPGNVRQLRYVVENACGMVPGYDVTGDAVQKQLDYQKLLHQEQRFKSYHQMKLEWENGTLSDKDLEAILNSYYLRCGLNWTEVARRLGLVRPSEIKAFTNWLWYVQKKKIIGAPAKL